MRRYLIPALPEVRALVVAVVVIIIVNVVGCGGSVVTPTATPIVSSARTSTAIATPQPAPTTGIDEIDTVVRATLQGEVDSLMAMVNYERVGCVAAQEEGGPPPCRTGEVPGTLVESFPITACGGTNERPDEVQRSIATAVRQPLQLYSVFRPSAGAADYYVVFAYAAAPERNGFTFKLTTAHITALSFTCNTVVDATRYVQDFIVTPPLGPHATMPGHIPEPFIAEFIPSPYNTFAVTGVFDGSVDEVGDTDAFSWSVAGSSVYDGQNRSWRVYWHRGQVFDCAASCTTPLSLATAAARLKALHSGDPVCIIGWADDIGNAEAEVVYLDPPAPCIPSADFFGRTTATPGP